MAAAAGIIKEFMRGNGTGRISLRFSGLHLDTLVFALGIPHFSSVEMPRPSDGPGPRWEHEGSFFFGAFSLSQPFLSIHALRN